MHLLIAGVSSDMHSVPRLLFVSASDCASVHSRCVLRLLIRLGDLPVAIDHLYQQPEGQEHQQHIHHDLRVERRGVCAGCGAQTTAKKHVLFSMHLTSECLMC